uniref:BSD domain-containing protein n=1 Tax=Trypanosoma congolense (strain IL3000) TaxID=1068625 RepID=G0UNZ5_TRYCI|nr:conserved hypothetical protein [Trypanosoma congolense IL3000]
MFQSLAAFVQTTADQARKFTEESLHLAEKARTIDVEEKCEAIAGWITRFHGAPSADKEANLEKTAEEPGTGEPTIEKALFVNPPAEWEATNEEWERLTLLMMQSSAACTIAPSMILDDEEAVSKVCELVGVDLPEMLPKPSTVGACSPSEGLVQWILSREEVHRFRSQLVPRYLSDEEYWANISWRFRLFQMCRNPSQLLDVMEITSSQRKSSTEEKPSGVGGKCVVKTDEISWQALRQELKELREHADWVRERCSTVKTELKLAAGNLQLLANFIKKGEVGELGDSLLESCKYHKTKLSRLLGNLKAQQERLENSELCCEKGTLFLQLVDFNEQLRKTIEAYVSIPKGGLPAPVVTTSPEDNPPDPAMCTAVDDEASGDVVFEAALPWENDIVVNT